MKHFLLNQAYWQAATQYGMIMSNAVQLGFEVPFGPELFSPTSPVTHLYEAVGQTGAVQAEAAPGLQGLNAQPPDGAEANNPLLNAPMNAEESYTKHACT